MQVVRIDHFGAQLARALRVTELRPGGLARADALFARYDPAPWCPEIF